MDSTPDELAGIVDLFGALTRSELHQAITDLSARTGDDFDPTILDDKIDAAIHEYYLLPIDPDQTDELPPSGTESVLVSGPAALPTIPPHGEDLPHIMEIEDRAIRTDTLRRAAEERLRKDAAQAVNDDDAPRIRDLLDTCYDLEAWAGVDTTQIRERLTSELDEGRVN